MQMRKSKIIAVLLVGTMLCNSIPLNIWASEQDAVFYDGESNVSADESTNLSGEVFDSNEAGTAEMNNEEENIFSDDEKFNDTSEDEFTDSVNVETDNELDAGQKGSTINNKSEISGKVRNLMINTNYSSYPLLEYDDPVRLAAGFSNTPEGFWQAFIKTYGDITTKNTLWEQEYEELLIDLLADKSLLKGITEVWDEDLAGIVSEVEGEVISDANDKLNIAVGVFTDVVRNKIKQDIGNILILSLIADNTDDKNLQKACQVCMADSFNATIRKIGDFLIEKAVDKGKEYLVAKQTIQNQILSTSLKKGFLSTIAQRFKLGTAATWVTKIIFVKDVVSYVSGINERVDNYLKTVSLSFIYDAAAKAYGNNVSLMNSGKNDAALNIYILFQFILSVKQEAYEDMEDMFTSSTWDAIIDSDPYLKINTEKIPTITIKNYTKRKLPALKPDVESSKLSLKVNAKKTFPCTGISYLSNVKYSSDNKKVVKINSAGEIQAKKVGTANIKCKVEQYGDTYELICKVTVKKETDSKDPSAAYRTLIKSYEKKYGSAKLNEKKQFWTGLCYAKLLDFNDDGINELILAYQTEKYDTNKVQYHVELWKYDGKSAKRVTSRISWSGNNMPYFGGLGICKYNGKYLLELTGNACGDDYYYGTKSDGSVGLVHKFIWKGDAMQGDWYHNGKKVSGNVYQTYYNKYHASAIWYGFSQASNNDIIKKEISKTKVKLNM